MARRQTHAVSAATETEADSPPRLSRHERQLLSVLRIEGPTPKSTVARRLDLSPTATGAIMNRLEDLGYVLRGEPRRGKIGQPSVPYRIAPRGALSFGVKIGRRSVQVALIDAEFQTIELEERVHDFPTVVEAMAFLSAARARLLAAIPTKQHRQICGVGVGMPSEIWLWSDQLDAPAGALDAWRTLDVRQEIESRFEARCVVVNDATAAAAAEHAMGRRSDLTDYLSIFVGWFIGGGVVLDGRLHLGRRGRSGEIGSMPTRESIQLIRTSSLATLERAWRSSGGDSELLWRSPEDWSQLGATLDAWTETAARDIAHAVASSACVIDFEAAIIDGAMPAHVRSDLTQRVRTAFEALDRQGLGRLQILEGSIGRNARSIGAGALPLLDRFSPEAADPRYDQKRAVSATSPGW